MESIEVSAKTVEDAVLEAAIQLGTTRDKVAYEVITQPTSGFLGIGGRKAVIRAHQKSDEEIEAKLKADKEMENLLDEVNITCNKNAIPNDPQSPFVTSGVRLGTAAVTSRGMNESDMDQIAEAIALVLDGRENAERAREIVKSLTDRYPLVG